MNMNMNGMDPNMMNMGMMNQNMMNNMPNMGMNMPNMGNNMPNMGMNMPNMGNTVNMGMNMPNMGMNMPNIGMNTMNMGNMGNMGMNMPNMGMNTMNIGNMGMNMPNMGMNMGGMGNMNMMNFPNMGAIPMVALPTMNTMMDIEDAQGWNLIFENQNNRKLINIRISEQKLVKEAINAYKLKVNDFDNKFKFIFNNKELFPEMKICQSGLTNGAKILVISTKNLKGAK